MATKEGKAFKGVVGRTPNQKNFIQTINEQDIVLCEAVMGTGKTYIAVGLACEYLIKGKVDKIVLARTTKHLVKEFGFNAGTWEEKSIAMFDQAVEYFIKFLGESQFNKFWDEHIIEFTSSSIIRGRSLYRTFYIVEEAQELNKEDWILLLSRLDKESKFLAIGDRDQNNAGDCFFARLFDNLEDEAVGKVRMGEEDVQRNKHIYRICKKIQQL